MHLVPASSRPQLLAFALLYGVGYGATYTLIQSKAARLYGREPDFPRLQSFLVLWQYIGSFLGVTCSAAIEHLSGSYGPSFAVFPLLGLAVCIHNACIDAGWRSAALRRCHASSGAAAVGCGSAAGRAAQAGCPQPDGLALAGPVAAVPVNGGVRTVETVATEDARHAAVDG